MSDIIVTMPVVPFSFSQPPNHQMLCTIMSDVVPALPVASSNSSPKPNDNTSDLTIPLPIDPGMSLVVPAVELIKFMKLPLELREMIWKYAIKPRLVHWRPGGGRLPAMMATCTESRRLTKDLYKLCLLPYLREQQYGMWINYDLDILYRKQHIPNIIDVEPRNSNYIFNIPSWMKYIKRLAVNLDEACRYKNTWRSQSIYVKIKRMCPELEELIVNVGPKLDKHHTVEDMSSFLTPTEKEDTLIFLAKVLFEGAQAKEMCQDVTMRFTTN